ncbi:hypothetical protein B0H69_000354 [Clostridium beijerinckii]|nr:hypothetical protein [Clostridium beijerinckii]NRT66083.1 hypothetical protein [Clostridium beijerinckii]NRT82408.1 hypothetical protein [Clostridium beijerinckii]NRU50891.1 hypothetical protein [Clostridium beijerinckii]NRZ30968.1 hypothetical protein [Clostridium beijerinckii]
MKTTFLDVIFKLKIVYSINLYYKIKGLDGGFIVSIFTNIKIARCA